MSAPVKTSPSNGSSLLATNELRQVTVPDFIAAKARGHRLTMLTAYDYTMARLLDDAGVDSLLVGDSLGMVVEAAGAFAVVVECVPTDLAARITAALKIPTIGIGAGPACDGQILVTPDLLGLFDDIRPRFVKHYAELGQAVRKAVETYCREVRDSSFPGPEHSFR